MASKKQKTTLCRSCRFGICGVCAEASHRVAFCVLRVKATNSDKRYPLCNKVKPSDI